MATTRLMTTVLPYSVDTRDEYHVSLFISHRLDGGGQLSDYAAMINWVKTLKNAEITLRSVEAGANPIPCTPLLDKASESAWKTAFPGDTKVRSYPEPKPSSETWNSFPANRIPDHAIEVHHASALSSPIDRPRVVGNPFAEDLLTEFAGKNTAGTVISAFRYYDRDRTNRLDRLRTAREQAARRAVAPVKPPPTVPTGPAFAENAAEDEPWRSPIEILLDPEHDDLDRSITEYLDYQLEHPERVAGNSILSMLVDLHRAQYFYHRKEEQPNLSCSRIRRRGWRGPHTIPRISTNAWPGSAMYRRWRGHSA